MKLFVNRALAELVDGILRVADHVTLSLFSWATKLNVIHRLDSSARL
jgi:hypothetical protein